MVAIISAGEDDAVFFRDADVVVTIRHRFFQMLQSRAAGHCGGDADQRVVFLAQFDERLAHHVLGITRGGDPALAGSVSPVLTS